MCHVADAERLLSETLMPTANKTTSTTHTDVSADWCERLLRRGMTLIWRPLWTCATYRVHGDLLKTGGIILTQPDTRSYCVSSVTGVTI